ncbi:beta-sandwich lipoprotein [Zhihengliuella halotolerans]|uniref:beta-sandwich lipoprotein n=1 Tax=Zhihengliuella halotolerans TaxID=370736 RepID=UPI000C7FE9EC|nr:hypothetical protein [Zhihengliuella halotolerans]
MKRKLIIIAATAAAALALVGCNDAEVASRNLSTDADNFKIPRRVVFINGITDKYALEIEGYCSIETRESKIAGAVEVTCKTGPGLYKKHSMGLSDNMTFVAEQLDPAAVSADHYKLTYKPTVIIPHLENTSGD